MTVWNAAPFTLHSIAFAYQGNPDAIPLRDPTNHRFVGDLPEWSSNGRREPAAYIRGARPRVRVVFARSRGKGPHPSGTWRVSAEGVGGPGLTEQEITLKFDQKGLSAPIDFQLDAPLPNAIGKLSPEWEWRARNAKADFPIGRSRHAWYVTWQSPTSPADWAWLKENKEGPRGERDRPWSYLPIVEWTCGWAAGKNNEKAICDAILAGLPASGLQYAVAAYTVRDMLVKGGGYCAGWYRMFQALAGSQGVKVERRTYSVDWEVQQGDESRWCAIVVEDPGINRRIPKEDASTFHDVHSHPAENKPLEVEHQRRYRFWGCPGLVADGHCINFLQYENRWYVYDACFGDRAVALENFTLPTPDPRAHVPVDTLGNFLEAYLAKSVRYMLGSLPYEGRLYKTLHPDPKDTLFPSKTSRNGLTILTSLFPNQHAPITFYWTE